jgi:signal transduction histidine kinase
MEFTTDGVACPVAGDAHAVLEGRAPPRTGEEWQRRLGDFQKMESLGRAALGVAHEFNNLLGVIAGHTELLCDNPGLDASTRDGLGEIRRAVYRAGELAQQLLRFGRRKPRPAAPVDLGAVVGGVRQMLRCLVGSATPLAVAPGAEPCPVRLDPGEVEQVVLNLVINARDATAAGGRILVTTEPVRLAGERRHAHGVVPAGAYARLAVSDSGCGMDAATVARLFEPFFTTKEAGRGTGLGLSIVAELLEQSGGHVTVWSEPGCGSRFEVYWPLWGG